MSRYSSIPRRRNSITLPASRTRSRNTTARAASPCRRCPCESRRLCTKERFPEPLSWGFNIRWFSRTASDITANRVILQYGPGAFVRFHSPLWDSRSGPGLHTGSAKPAPKMANTVGGRSGLDWLSVPGWGGIRVLFDSRRKGRDWVSSRSL